MAQSLNDAVIVATARTGIGRAGRGALNDTHGAQMGGHVIAEVVRRAGIDPGSVEDVLIGCAAPEGATGNNIARQAAIEGGLPVSVAAATLDRKCASGLFAIATAAQRIRCGEADSSSPAVSNRSRSCGRIATIFARGTHGSLSISRSSTGP